jgi:hypothetical protein
MIEKIPLATWMNDFRYEADARRHTIKSFWTMLLTAIGLTFGGAWMKHHDPFDGVWFWRIWFTFCAITFGLTFFWLGPLIKKIPAGSVFRVNVTQEYIQVESPHEHFGPSYKIPLDEIVELRTVMSGSDVSKYQIQTRDGSATKVTINGNLDPSKVFEYIQSIRPNIQHRRVPMNDSTRTSMG